MGGFPGPTLAVLASPRLSYFVPTALLSLACANWVRVFRVVRGDKPFFVPLWLYGEVPSCSPSVLETAGDKSEARNQKSDPSSLKQLRRDKRKTEIRNWKSAPRLAFEVVARLCWLR
jgi:hypothetical protein